MLYSENIHFSKKGISFTDKDGRVLSFGSAFGKITGRIGSWFSDFGLMLLHFVSEHVIFGSIRKIVFKLAGLKIGRGSTIHMGVRFFAPRGITIGSDTVIGFGSFLDGRAPLKIGNHVDIASEVMVYNSEHNLESPYFEAIEEKVEIGDYAFIGPRAIILPGVKVGRGAVVAAGAVVTKDVEEYSIVAGVPAKVIGERTNKNLSYYIGRTRLFQ
jgi:maltose O-acetyltransferase